MSEAPVAPAAPTDPGTADRTAWAPIAEVDPELWDAMVQRARAPARQDRADRQRELHVRRGHGGAGLVAHEQVRRGPARASATTAAASTSTSPSGSPRSARSRSSRAPSTSTSSPTPARRRTWPPTSASLAARRPDPRDEPRPRRPPDPRLARSTSPASCTRSTRTASTRGPSGSTTTRSRRRPREVRPKMIVAGASRLPADHRLRADGGDRPRRRRAAVRRHGAHRRARRGGRPSEPVPARRHRHDDDAQDAPRAARRPHLRRADLPDGVDRPTSRASRRPSRADRQGRLPGRPGRAAHARHRRQGRRAPSSPRRDDFRRDQQRTVENARVLARGARRARAPGSSRAARTTT